MDETYTLEEINAMFSAMDDSVNLLNELITAGEHSEDIDDTVDRNYRHLEIMLAKDHIASDERDKTSYTDVIADSKTFLGL
jgi:hypothetical protein